LRHSFLANIAKPRMDRGANATGSKANLSRLDMRLKWMKVLPLLVGVLGLLVAISPNSVAAQSPEEVKGWSKPILLFGEPKIEYPVVAADPSGVIHVIWTKDALDDAVERDTAALYYARWDGASWSKPVDVLLSSSWPRSTLVADERGMLHLTWLGTALSLAYSQAFAGAPPSPQSWTSPCTLSQSEQSLFADIEADKYGTLHVAYPVRGGDVYYTQSVDGGNTWSAPVNVSVRQNYDMGSEFVRLAADDQGRIHIAWTMFPLPKGWPPLGTYYARSDDGGQTWSQPLQIAGQGYDEMNVFTVGADIVHLAWNGMAGLGGRYHQWSADGGQTWSQVSEIIPPPGGGTAGFPDFALDSAGTVHMIIDGQDCLLYSYWDSSQWARPECIPSTDEMGPIEDARLTVSEGNRLHVVFPENFERLWYTTRLVNAPHIPPLPLPTVPPVPTASPTATATPEPTPTSTPERSTSDSEPLTSRGLGSANTSYPLLVGIPPAVLLIVVIVLVRTRVRRP
jgi:hypothetical protein